MSLEISSSPTQLDTNNKRLSKIPLGILAVIVLLILFSIVYAAIARKQSLSRQDNIVTEESKKQSQSNGNKDLNSYIDSLAQVTPPMSDSTTTQKVEPIQAPLNTMNDKRPMPPILPNSQTNNTPQIDQKELQLKQDMRLKALTSASKLGGLKYDDRNQQNQTNNKTSDMNSTTALVASLAASAEKLSESAATELLKRTANKGYLQQQKQRQISPYEIKAGWIIPATLITGINSDLPGSTLAQVSQNIYDTATGHYLLIPQGTKLVGEYKSNVLYGQERVLTAWTKLIFPNGDTLNIEGMNGTSQDGYSGFTDQVNNHYLRIFGSAFLMSSITAGVALNDNSSGQKETSADKAMSQAIEQMSTVSSEMIRKNMNISPTLEIRPGYKFNIFVTKDIILEPLNIEKGE